MASPPKVRTSSGRRTLDGVFLSAIALAVADAALAPPVPLLLVFGTLLALLGCFRGRLGLLGGLSLAVILVDG
ncbi:MAG TPA: hypothetical protein VN083_00925, partial [Vicinamibacteria bacterium]|nr:hypothetical protein [Vicinamibacteria bacterium]